MILPVDISLHSSLLSFPATLFSRNWVYLQLGNPHVLWLWRNITAPFHLHVTQSSAYTPINYTIKEEDPLYHDIMLQSQATPEKTFCLVLCHSGPFHLNTSNTRDTCCAFVFVPSQHPMRMSVSCLATLLLFSKGGKKRKKHKCRVWVVSEFPHPSKKWFSRVSNLIA